MTKDCELPDCQRIAMKHLRFTRLSCLGIGKSVMHDVCNIHKL